MKILLAVVLGFLTVKNSYSWDQHQLITRLSLKSWDQWEQVKYEPLDLVLPVLRFDGKKILSRADFYKNLAIRGEKMPWDEAGPAAVPGEPYGLTLVAWSSDHPDLGMDQEMNLSPDQEFIGGYTGLSSQAIRHMYWQALDFKKPLLTFHFPKPVQPMGFAHERAQLFFEFAVQARKAGHWYWAYRFLGMSLHYAQDINQPYHSHQFGSLVIVPFEKLISGKKAFLDEATRIIGNYHLFFEQMTLFYLDKALKNSQDSNVTSLLQVFKVPHADSAELSRNLNGNMDLSVKQGVVLMAENAAPIAPLIVGDEKALWSEHLTSEELKLGEGFFYSNGAPKIDMNTYEKPVLLSKLKRRREGLLRFMSQSLSNTAVSTRWIFDKFRLKD